jgi:hypothetical protein
MAAQGRNSCLTPSPGAVGIPSEFAVVGVVEQRAFGRNRRRNGVAVEIDVARHRAGETRGHKADRVLVAHEVVHRVALVGERQVEHDVKRAVGRPDVDGGRSESRRRVKSGWCQQKTHALQQKGPSFDHPVGVGK